MAKCTQKKIAIKLTAKASAGDEEISPEQQGELKELGEEIRSLGRRSTKQALELGGYLSRAKSILPEKALGAWIKAVCKFTPKTGRNYIAVHTNLIDYKEQLVSAAVAPTVLFVLAYAERSDVESVIAAIEAGEQLTVAKVKAMVGVEIKQKLTSTDHALNVGGVAGLRKAAELKTTQDVAHFHALMSSVLKRVEEAMEPIARGRAVKKGMLQEAIMYDCRDAHDLLNSIAAPLKPDVTAHLNWRPEKLPDGSNWRKVQGLLHRMGGAEDWPDRSSFVPWLQNEVVPLLRFVVHGHAILNQADDEAPADIALQIEEQIDDGLLAYPHMPPAVQDKIDTALEIISPEARVALQSNIVFDPRPMRHQYKKVAA